MCMHPCAYEHVCVRGRGSGGTRTRVCLPVSSCVSYVCACISVTRWLAGGLPVSPVPTETRSRASPGPPYTLISVTAPFSLCLNKKPER